MLFIDRDSYNHAGSAKNMTYKGYPWNKKELPSDPEIVAGVFGGFLD